MLNLTTEEINEIKKVNSIEELESKIKEQNIEVSKEAISSLYNMYCVSNTELSDDELNGVTGGCGSETEEPQEETPAPPESKFKIGDAVKDSRGWRFIVRDMKYHPEYSQYIYDLEITQITTETLYTIGEIYVHKERDLFDINFPAF